MVSISSLVAVTRGLVDLATAGRFRPKTLAESADPRPDRRVFLTRRGWSAATIDHAGAGPARRDRLNRPMFLHANERAQRPRLGAEVPPRPSMDSETNRHKMSKMPIRPN
jgi:hypothetical protein